MKTAKVNQVATFEKLLGFCNAQSAVYNPSKASIQLTALNSLLTQAREFLRAVDSAHVAYVTAINKREEMFDKMLTLSRRTIHALKASEASAETLSDAIQLKNRLTTSRRLRKPVTDANGEPPAPNAKRSYGVTIR